RNLCHLSRRSYPYLMAVELGYLANTTQSPPADGLFHSVACSGAKIHNIIGGTEEKQSDGSVVLMLVGGDYYEQSLFADCLSEVLGQIENPRYLVTRKMNWLGKKRVDYHAVPAVLGTKKKRAAQFFHFWKKRVSDGDLIYARGQDGRAVLLKARARAFSTAAERHGKRLDRWQ
ncbi:MAG: hypothetical protein ACPGYQ_06240, partial [Candidatus Puniceispirillales bacterium]